MRCIIPILGVMIIVAGCDKPRHHYVYDAKAAVYAQKGNQWTVKYLGPQTIELHSRMDALSEGNLGYVFFRLPGISSFKVIELDSCGEGEHSYYDFEFSIFHIEYRDYVSDLQKHDSKNYFVEGGSVTFNSRPVHYDPSLVQYVIAHAIEVN